MADCKTLDAKDSRSPLSPLHKGEGNAAAPNAQKSSAARAMQDALPSPSVERGAPASAASLKQSAAGRLAVMRRVEIKHGAERHHPVGVDGLVTVIIVVLDMGEVHRLAYARPLVQFAQVAREMRVIGDAAQIAFEMPDIDRIETHQRGEEPPIGFGDGVADEIAPRREPFVEIVEGGEERGYRFLIGFLRGGEAGFVDAVIDGVVDARVDRVDLRAQGLRGSNRRALRPHCRRRNSACG